MLGFDLRKVAKLQRYVSQFEDLGVIDSGGFGDVHRVRNRLDCHLYAAKIIKIKPSPSQQDNEERLYRLLAEPKAQAIIHHPNILQYHGCWLEVIPFSEKELAEMQPPEVQDQAQFEMVVLNNSEDSQGIVFGSMSSEGKAVQASKPVREQSVRARDGSLISEYKQLRVYVLTELCQCTLQGYLSVRNSQRQSTQLTRQELTKIYRFSLDIIAGLFYLHSQRIIHRDIKLQNIMIDTQGKCKLIDFGLAKKVKYWKSSITESFKYSQQQQPDEQGDQKFSSSIGTKLFSSPEQANSQKYDYRTDIYSLAIVLALLFSLHTTAHQQRDLLQQIRKKNLSSLAIPSSLKLLLAKSLSAENERPSLAELQSCLKQLLASNIRESRPLSQQYDKVECCSQRGNKLPLGSEDQQQMILVQNQ